MHWIGLVDRPEHVCCRYRLAAFRPLLARAGHTLELRPLPRRWWSRLAFFQRLRGANVILQRRLLCGWQRVLLRRAARRLLFDFDDAVFLRDSYAAKGLHDRRRLRRFAGLVRCADAVIAGNTFLAEHAARWTAGSRVHVIPTCVDPERYPPVGAARRAAPGVRLGAPDLPPIDTVSRAAPGVRLGAPDLPPIDTVSRAAPGVRLGAPDLPPIDTVSRAAPGVRLGAPDLPPIDTVSRAAPGVRLGAPDLPPIDTVSRAAPGVRLGAPDLLIEPARKDNSIELVWVGSSSTLQGLQAIAPLLEEIGRNVPGLCLKLICNRFLQLRNLPVMPVPWREAGEAEEIARADIGISWVPDDLWSRGKCGLKVLQYMVAGLPVIANPVGVQVEMVRHGETGYLAETPAQWVEAVRRLAHDPELRRRMGHAGRRRVESHYSVAAGAARWVTLLNGLREPLAA